MPDASSILEQLKHKGSEKTRVTYARHGMATERTFGVSVADLKTFAKQLKGQQKVALELYASGMMEAMYLAGMVADGAAMTRPQLKQWAEGAAGFQMIFEHTVPWVTVENAAGRTLALEWMKSKKEHVAAAGWCTYSGLVATLPDEKLDLAEIESLLKATVSSIDAAKNRVRYTMNGFVISVGAYVEPLLKHASVTAAKLGNVSVDVGDTACNVPVATDYIAKIETMGRVGKKRKTIRC